jgi:hypothetical protein
VKKSSTRSSRVEKGQIDSAERTACEEKDASVAATLLGDAGDEKPGDSRRRRLMASACRFGGPRRRLGLSKVHGMSSAAQARHGGPDSSHYSEFPVSLSLSVCACVCVSRHGHAGNACLGARFNALLTLTLRILHESHALRKRFPFWLSPPPLPIMPKASSAWPLELDCGGVTS